MLDLPQEIVILGETLPSLPIFLSLGFAVGLLSGLLGIGGGWLITPSLNAFGFPITNAVATGLTQMAGTSLLALLRHKKHGNVELKLGITIGLSMILSVGLGKSLLVELEKTGHAGLLTRSLYIFLLSFISLKMFKDLLFPKKETDKKSPFSSFFNIFRRGPKIYISQNKSETHLLLAIFLGVVAGFLSGIMGVGGGFLLVPAMVSLLGLPTLSAVATSLVCVFFSGASGSFFFSLSGKVDWSIALVLIIGSFFGSLIGVSSTQYIKEKALRFLFAFLTLCAAFSSLFKQINLPEISKVTILFPALMILLYSLSTVVIGKFFKKRQ